MGMDDLVYVILMLLFVVVPVIGQLLAKLKQPQPPGGGQQPQRPRPINQEVADEIETFMRRVLGQREVEEKPPARRRPAPVEPPVVVEAIEAAPVAVSVGEHVKKHVEPEKLSRRAAQLGRDVALADEQFVQHAHQVFDHQLGDLKTPAIEQPEPAPAAAVEVPATFAAGLAAILSNAASVRQAIVLSEIINRPEDRWA
ncbi:MAG: hypothetical protein JW959_06060 [Pirellulales bacterium]|nr:hypothetical protein [Pirellulales bacterium]